MYDIATFLGILVGRIDPISHSAFLKFLNFYLITPLLLCYRPNFYRKDEMRMKFRLQKLQLNCTKTHIFIQLMFGSVSGRMPDCPFAEAVPYCGAH